MAQTWANIVIYSNGTQPNGIHPNIQMTIQGGQQNVQITIQNIPQNQQLNQRINRLNRQQQWKQCIPQNQKQGRDWDMLYRHVKHCQITKLFEKGGKEVIMGLIK